MGWGEGGLRWLVGKSGESKIPPHLCLQCAGRFSELTCWYMPVQGWSAVEAVVEQCNGLCGLKKIWLLTAHTSYHQYLTPFLPTHQDRLSILCAVINDEWMNYTTLLGFETTFEKCIGTLFTTWSLLYGYNVSFKALVPKVSCVDPLGSTISSQGIRGYM